MFLVNNYLPSYTYKLTQLYSYQKFYQIFGNILKLCNADSQSFRQSDIETNQQAERQTCKIKYKQTVRCTQTVDKQTTNQVNRKGDRHANRQINKKKSYKEMQTDKNVDREIKTQESKGDIQKLIQVI